MRVLVACEFSNTVRDAFLARGHDAYSCDLQRADHPNVNWRRHIQGDVRPLLRERWDLVIAHPPCTYLSNTASHLLTPNTPLEQQERGIGIMEGAIFFLDCLSANAPRICVENPIHHKFARELIPFKPTQTIQPWMFGHSFTKATRLWLIGLPLLKPTNIIKERRPYVATGDGGIAQTPNDRSRTFPGIARAMAEQWGSL